MLRRSKASRQDRPAGDGREWAVHARRVQALRLWWTRLRRGHALVGGSCACGHGQVHVRPEDFEYYILDHLDRKYRAAGQEKLARFLGHDASAAASLETRLDRLLQPAACRDLSTTDIALLLDDLQRSLESFADATT